MKWCGILGAIHGLLGSSLLFLSLHPLRDALDAHSLELLRVGATLEAIQGGLCLLLYTQIDYRLGTRLIASGTSLWCSMLYWIVFVRTHPLDIVVPIGGLIMMLGWVAMVITTVRRQFEVK